MQGWIRARAAPFSQRVAAALRGLWHVPIPAAEHVRIDHARLNHERVIDWHAAQLAAWEAEGGAIAPPGAAICG